MDIFEWVFKTVHRRKDLAQVGKLKSSIKEESELFNKLWQAHLEKLEVLQEIDKGNLSKLREIPRLNNIILTNLKLIIKDNFEALIKKILYESTERLHEIEGWIWRHGKEPPPTYDVTGTNPKTKQLIEMPAQPKGRRTPYNIENKKRAIWAIIQDEKKLEELLKKAWLDLNSNLMRLVTLYKELEPVLKKQSEEAKKGIWTGFGSEENQTSWYKEDKRLREIRITLSNITNKIILLARDMSKIELEEQAIEGQLKKEAKKKVGVMLIHGITGLPTAMDEFDLYLRQKGYITYKVRLPGHGRTMEEFFYTPVSEIEDFLISAFKYFYQYMSDINYGDGRFYVIGNSLGSMMPLHIMAINRQGLYPYQSMVKGIVSMSACVIPATAYPLFKYPTATKAVSSVMDFLSKWVGVSKGGSKVDKLINKIKKRDLAPDKFEETVKQEIKPLIKKMLEKRKKSFEQKGLEYAYTDQDIQRIIETIMNNLKQGNIALDKADVINIDAILTTKSMQGSALKTVSAIGKFTMQLKEDVKHIKIPILILQGLHDTVTHPSSADYIYGSVQTPWKFKKVVFLSKSGHNPNIDYDKDRVFEESFGFIERVEKEQEKIESTPIYE